MNERQLDDRLRAALDGIAGDIDVDVEPADALARRARLRRTRRRVVGGCAVGAIAVAGIVVLSDGDDGSVQTADEGTTSPRTLPLVVTEGDAPDGGETPADGDAATVVTTPPTLPETADVAANAASGEGIDAASSFVGGADVLLPWQDGFLLLRTEYPPQPLGPLPDEVIARFPTEVLDLFPDGLPPTLDEAMRTLDEAGLMNEVTDVLAEYPEVQEAIFAQPPPPPVQRAEFTTDGETWTPVDLDVPGMVGPPQYAATSTGLTVWSMEDYSYGPDGRPLNDDGARTLTIAHSTDLSTWSTATLEVGAPAPDADYLRSEIRPSGVAATADRWVAVLHHSRWIDAVPLLPEEYRAAASEGLLDWGQTPEGIEVYRFAENGDADTTAVFTWAELGVDADTVDPETWFEVLAFTGDFDGAVEPSSLPQDSAYGSGVIAVGATFYASGEQALRSTDGTTWTPIEGFSGRWLSSGVPLDNGSVMLIGESPIGQTAWVLDADGGVTEMPLPELPRPYGVWGPSPSAAFVVEVSERLDQSWEPVTVVIERDGFGIELTNGPETTSFLVTDLADGTVVFSADLTSEDADVVESLYEYDDEVGEGGLVFRDADGVEIVRVPDSVLEAAYQEAYPAESDLPAEEGLEWRPDLWLIATRDGVDWLTLDIDDPDPDGDWFPLIAAINGDRVLYATADGWSVARVGD